MLHFLKVSCISSERSSGQRRLTDCLGRMFEGPHSTSPACVLTSSCSLVTMSIIHPSIEPNSLRLEHNCIILRSSVVSVAADVLRRAPFSCSHRLLAFLYIES